MKEAPLSARDLVLAGLMVFGPGPAALTEGAIALAVNACDARADGLTVTGPGRIIPRPTGSHS